MRKGLACAAPTIVEQNAERRARFRLRSLRHGGRNRVGWTDFSASNNLNVVHLRYGERVIGNCCKMRKNKPDTVMNAIQKNWR